MPAQRLKRKPKAPAAVRVRGKRDERPVTAQPVGEYLGNGGYLTPRYKGQP